MASCDDNTGVTGYIADIDDLDMPISNGRVKFNPSRSENIPIVCRSATCVSSVSKENEDPNGSESSDLRQKLKTDKDSIPFGDGKLAFSAVL